MAKLSEGDANQSIVLSFDEVSNSIATHLVDGVGVTAGYISIKAWS